MLKIAILTRTSTVNFGTILQNYALQKFLKQKGLDAYTVDDVNPRLIYSNKKSKKVEHGHQNHLSFKSYFIQKIYEIKEKIDNREYIKREKNIDFFKRKNINYYFVNDIENLNKDFDVFIVGSDQIWSYSAEPLLYEFFMLKDIDCNKHKIAYAVSVGEISTDSKWQLDARKYLDKFDILSVRENASKENIINFVNKKIHIVCDPVFLLNTRDWCDLANSCKHKNKGKYILCYFLSNNEWYFSQADNIVKQTGLKVRLYQKEITKNKYKKAQIYSPNDFLNAIRNAEFVLTDSYHCVLFSIVFKRNFLVLKRYAQDNNTQNSRIIEMLQLIGCNDRWVEKYNNCSFGQIIYENASEKLNKFINKSKNFLDNNLNFDIIK